MSLNLNTLRTPGVFIDEKSTLPPSVAAVETAIPAFVGYTKKRPDDINVPKLITSFLEFEGFFGGPPSPGAGGNQIAVEVTIRDTFVDNYTDPNDPATYIDSTFVSREVKPSVQAITPSHNMYFAVRHYFDNGGGKCYIVSVGGYGAVGDGELVEGINALRQEDEPTLIVVPEAAVGGLTAAGYNNVYQTALNQCNDLKDRFTIIDVIQALPSALEDINAFQGTANLGDYGLYGAAYYPYLESTVDFVFEEDDKNAITIVYEKKLADGSDSNQADGPEDPGANLGAITNNQLEKQIINALRNMSIVLPPSSAMAGIYSRVDNSRGVWKAPANVSVGSIVGPVVKINNTIQDVMNIHPAGGKSVNAIRHISGRGTLVWGARTLDGNDNEWRYISVRRFFNFVEESVKKSTAQFVFEPNDANTWVKIRAMIENFLTLQWSQGALQGAKPEQAFFVRVGLGQTMTADDILNGRLIVEIGMAVVRPAEFIILRFMHKLPEA